MSRWGWSASRALTGSDPCPAWLRFLSLAAPWLSAGILLLTLFAISGSFTYREGVFFSLPDKGTGDVADVSMSVLVVPAQQGTLLFFDDTRYILDDERQMEQFSSQLARNAALSADPVLLVLADKRVKGGELMALAGTAKSCGVKKILFAEKGKYTKGR